ncbi:MAG: hypothetical protein F2702_04740 [Actinobacteria bacterium]|uniref:Unannotated protein n=1 Tax=freshwater metagenome TaxID=449393 RepID=A0A6J6U1T2_9ZZZZ|nr:hypothetical protein [Actinomycetota bacterium]
MNSAAGEFERELNRVVDRLRGMTMTRLPASADLAHATAQRLLSMTIAAGDSLPAELPRLGDHAAGDQLAVIAPDFMALQLSNDEVTAATELLTKLRRSLP